MSEPGIQRIFEERDTAFDHARQARRRVAALQRTMLEAASKLEELGNEEPRAVAAHLRLVAHPDYGSAQLQQQRQSKDPEGSQ